MGKSGRTIIASLFFLQFVVLGITQPVMSLYCRDYLSFSGFQIGIVLSSATVAAILAPVITIFIADRIISCENLLALLQLLAAVVLCLLPGARAFLPVFLFYLLVTIFCHPTNALLNAITFRNLGNQGDSFGSLRVWGTLGWIGAALFLTFFWLNDKVHLPFQRSFSSIFYVAAAASASAALIIITLRKKLVTGIPVPESLKERKAASIRLTKEGKRIFLSFLFICFLVAVQDKYYFLGISPFLKDCGFKESSIISVISIGMMSEVFFMILLRRLLSRFGIKLVMMIGAFGAFLRFLIFMVCGGSYLVVCGIFFHGLAFALYMAVAYIYLDSFCSSRNRAAVHQFYSLVTSGLGSLAGNLVGGLVFDQTVSNGGSYPLFWSIPCLISLAVVVLLHFHPFVRYTNCCEKE